MHYLHYAINWSGTNLMSRQCCVSAHTTQFANVGWRYLKHGFGVNALKCGGSLVSLISPDLKDLTVIMETMV